MRRSLRHIAWVPAVVFALLAACSSTDDPSPLSSSGATSSGSGTSSGSSGTSSGSSSGDASSGGDGASDGSSSGDAATDAALPAYTVSTILGLKLIRSVTVHKNGGEDRIIYVEESKIGSYPASGPLPDGARFVMQVNGGGNFVIEKVAGAWQYGNLNTGTNPATFPTTAPNASCNGCHSGAAEPGHFTIPSLRRLIKTHKGEEITCPAGPGPTPCNSSVYQ